MNARLRMALLCAAVADAAEDAPMRWYPSPYNCLNAEESAVYAVWYGIAHRAWCEAAATRSRRDVEREEMAS